MYGQSKLANALFAFEVARRLRDTRVTANTLHPGIVLTNIDRAGPVLGRLRSRLSAWWKPYHRVHCRGCRHSGLSVDRPGAGDGERALFRRDCNPVLPQSPHLRDEALAQALWTRSIELVGSHLR